MRRIVSLVVGGALVLGACPSVQAAPARATKVSRGAKPGAPSDPAKQAQALYNEGKYLEAAQAFEALAPSEAKYAYYAGLAYEAHGFDAQAILLWERIAEAAGVEAGVREKTRSRLAAAKGRTSELRVVVSPAAAAGPATLYFQGAGERPPLEVPVERLSGGVFLDPGPWSVEVDSARAEYGRGTGRIVLDVKSARASVEVVLPPIEQSVTLNLGPPKAITAGLKVTLTDAAGLAQERSFVAQGKVHGLRLRTGRWTYVAEAPRHAPVSGEIAVAADGPQEFTIALKPIERARSELRPLAIGMGVTSVLLAAGGGVGVWLSERAIVEPVSMGGETYYPVPRDADDPTATVLDPLDRLNASRALLGVSAGFLVTSLTAVGPRPIVRKWAWVTEGVLGAVLTSVGAGLFFKASKDLEPAIIEAKITDKLLAHKVEENEMLAAPATLLMGAGAALLVGATTGLILERRSARKGKAYARGRRLRLLAPLSFSF